MNTLFINSGKAVLVTDEKTPNLSIAHSSYLMKNGYDIDKLVVKERTAFITEDLETDIDVFARMRATPIDVKAKQMRYLNKRY
jgi:hypothetical protein